MGQRCFILPHPTGSNPARSCDASWDPDNVSSVVVVYSHRALRGLDRQLLRSRLPSRAGCSFCGAAPQLAGINSSIQSLFDYGEWRVRGRGLMVSVKTESTTIENKFSNWRLRREFVQTLSDSISPLGPSFWIMPRVDWHENHFFFINADHFRALDLVYTCTLRCKYSNDCLM